MRNLFRRSSLLVALLMAITLLSSDILTAEPAGAASVSRPVVRSTTKTKRPATVRRVRPRYKYKRSRWARASRSAVRPRAVRAQAVPTGDVWARLRQCESGGRYNINSGNGFYGAYQFRAQHLARSRLRRMPHQAPPRVQDAAAQKLQVRSGRQWPACTRKLGLR